MLRDDERLPDDERMPLPDYLKQEIKDMKPVEVEFVFSCELDKKNIADGMIFLDLPDDICGQNFNENANIDVDMLCIGPNSCEIVFLLCNGYDEYLLTGNWKKAVNEGGKRILKDGGTLNIWAFKTPDDTVSFAMDYVEPDVSDPEDEESDDVYAEAKESNEYDEDDWFYKAYAEAPWASDEEDEEEEEEYSDEEKPEKQKPDEEEEEQKKSLEKPDEEEEEQKKSLEKPDITINKATSV